MVVPAITEANVAPPIVISSASKVPSMSALPLISSVAASSSPAIVNRPELGLYDKPVSVSAPCVPVISMVVLVLDLFDHQC